MTWLDWFVRDRADSVRAVFRKEGWGMTRTADGSPNIIAALGAVMTVKILEYSVNPEAYTMHEDGRKRAYESILLNGCILPFLNGFIPADRRNEKLVSGPGLGLLLSRETANMLADAAPPAADPWRQRVFAAKPEGAGLGGVYVDIPHGALRLGKGLQVRALFATPWRALMDEADPESKVVQTGTVLLAAVITAQGSERPEGLTFLVVDEEDRVRVVGMPDAASVAGFINADDGQLGETASTDPMELFNLVYERTAGFFRLVLAYHRYGPVEARSEVKVTSAAKFVRNHNLPRKGESIFAMVRLAAPNDRLGRAQPKDPNAGWVLTTRQDVAGHFKLQAHGPGLALRKLIWVESYPRGPQDAPLRPHAVRV